jgi:uncharacterized protein (TIGR03067 family)
MTAFVLVLAGVTARDGGTGSGASEGPQAAVRGPLEGTWAIVSMTEEGASIPDHRVSGVRFEVDGVGRYAFYDLFRFGKRPYECGRLAFGRKGSPQAIDFRVTHGLDKGQTLLGVYEVEGDWLLRCHAQAGVKVRPRSVRPAAGGGGVVLLQLKRVKP